MKHTILIGLALLMSFPLIASEPDSLKNKFGNQIDAKTIEITTETRLSNALFGRLKGLYVMQDVNSYNPLDYGASMLIRGAATFGNKSPLILVDGIERDLSSLSISEVDKVEVLKDGVAAAIYGVRGANGVISVTTKRGSKGFSAKVNYSTSIDTPIRLPKFADSYNYANLLNEALVLDDLAPRYSEAELGYFKDGTNRELYPNVDWQKMAYNDFGIKHQADIQVKGGSNKFKYYTMLSYYNINGMLSHTNMFPQYNSQLNKVQFNVRSNIDAKLTETTKMQLGLMAKLNEQTSPGVQVPNIISRMYNIPSAAFPVKTGTKKWGGSNIYPYNPIADIADKGFIKSVNRSLFADLSILQDLKFLTEGLYMKATISFDNMARYNDKRIKNYDYEMVTSVLDNDGNILGCNRTPLGVRTELGWGSSLNSLEMYASFNTKLGYDWNYGSHVFKSALVYNQVGRVRDGRNHTMKRQSIYATLNYDYKSKYEVDAIINYSGSAVLPKGKKFNLYPAVGLGWVLSNEDFLKDNSVINYLKLKTSLGYSGSDLFAHDLDMQSFGVPGGQYWFGANNTSFPGISEGPLPVENLLAEKSMKYDLGCNLTLLNKLNLGINYFFEKRSNILVNGSTVISNVLGINVPKICEGEVQNNGVELNLDYADRIGDFSYSFSGNFTYAKNKIIENNEGYKPYDYLSKKGHSIDEQYGLVSNGFFNSNEEIENSEISQSFGVLRPGDIKYVDQNGDNVINEHDIVKLGYSSTPEIYYGFNIGMAYSSLRLDAQFQGVANRDIYLNTNSVFMPMKNNSNISTWYLEDNVRWTPETSNSANLPRLTTEDNQNNFRKSDVWICNGSFLKLRNLQLSYTFDKKITKYINLTLFLRGSNLFSIDALGYMDPENYGAEYPSMRSYSFGINVKF